MNGTSSTLHAPILPPVTVHLLTGALGSGKTTFLRHILEHRIFGEPVAVIVNDFGDVVYDALLLRQSQYEERQSIQPQEQTPFMIIDVPGGCLCCSAVDEFKEALASIVARGYKRIFIEATGLADAEQVRSDVAFMVFPVEYNLCMVDMLNYSHIRRAMAVVDAQIAAADILLFSKTDCAPEEQIREHHRLVRTVNSRAAIVYVRRGKAPTDFLITAFAPAEHFTAEHHTRQQHLLHDNITAFRVLFGNTQHVANVPPCVEIGAELDRGIDYQTLERALQTLPDAVFRVKGIVWLHDHHSNQQLDHQTNAAEPFLLNYVCGHAELIPVKALYESATNTPLCADRFYTATYHTPEPLNTLNTSTTFNTFNMLNTSQLFIIGRNVSQEHVLACFHGIPNVTVESGTVRSRRFLEQHH